MPSASSLGTAYIDVEPRLDGLKRDLTRKVTPVARRAGRDLGRAVGRDASRGLDRLGKSADRADKQVKPLSRELRGLGKGVGRGAERDLDRMGRAAKTADRHAHRLGNTKKRLSGHLKAAGAAAVAAGSAYVGLSAAKGAITSTTDLAKTTLSLHKNLGLSVKSASEFGAVLKARGVETSKVNMAFGTLSKQIDAANQGGKTQIEVFKRLGITQRELKRLKPEELMRQLADGFQKAGSGPQRMALGMRLFGRGWQSILPILRGGSKELDAQLKKANLYGATFGGTTVKSMEDFIKAQREAKLATMGLQVAFGTMAAPKLTAGITLANRELLKLRSRFRELRGEGKSGGEAGQVIAGEQSERLAKLFEKAAPKIAEAAGRAAPRAVKAFVKVWQDSPLWGKLAIGGLLLAKSGAGGGIAKMLLGRAAGGGAAGGVGGLATKAAPMPVFVVNQMPGGVGGKMPPVVPAGKPPSWAAGLLGRLGPLAGAGYMGFRGAQQGRDYLKGNVRSGVQRGLDVGKGIPSVRPVADLASRIIGKPADDQKIKKRLTGIRLEVQQLGKVLGKPVRLRIDADPKKSVKDLRSIRANFDFLRKATFIDMKTMLRTTGDTFTRIKRTMDVNSTAGQKAVTDNFKLGARHIKSALNSGEISTKQGMSAISRLLKQHSGGGKEAVKQNMFEIRKVLASTMDKGVSITDKGAGRIRRIFAKELKAYGITGREAEIYLDTKPGKGKPLNYQRGGLMQLGREGQRGRDSIPLRAGGQNILAAPGEKIAVLNDQQQAELNARTADVGGLSGFFQRFRRPHYMARGGIVPVPGEAGTTIHKSILADVLKLDRRYKLDINDGYAPTGHAAGGDHPKGMGFDAGPDFGAGGSWGLVSKLAKWAEPTQGSPRDPFRWIGYTGDSGHGPGDHIHVGFKGPGITGLGDVGRIARQRVGGPDSALRAMAQRVLDRTRGAAQKKLDSLASSAGGGAGGITGVGPVGGGAASRSQMMRWARLGLAQSGVFPPTPGNVEKILALARKESGWDPKSINMWDSNAKAGNPSGGLMHITMDKVGGSKSKLFDPVENIAVSARYQKEQYGGLVTHSPYARGGILRGLGTFPSASEIKRQEKRVGGLKTKLGDKKDTKGYSWAEKRQTKVKAELDRARSVLGSMKAKRKKGLKRRTKGQKRLSDRVEGFKLPASVLKTVTTAERHIEDLSAIYDQDETGFRLDEVLSQGELDTLVAQKTHIRNLVGGDPWGTGGQAVDTKNILSTVAKKITGVTKFIERLKARVRKNMKVLKNRIRRAEHLRNLIKKKDGEIAKAHKLKNPKTRKARIDALAKDKTKLQYELGHITQREIPALEADNMAVVGQRRPTTLSGKEVQAGSGALLPDARAVLGEAGSTAGGEGGIDLRGFAAEFTDRFRPGALPAEWKTHDNVVKALLREGATKPEVKEDANASGLADALKEQLAESRLRTAVSEAQFKVLRDAPRFGGVFHEGGMVPGPVGAERMILAKGGEIVTPSGEGQDVRVVIEDHRTRVFVDNREVRAVVRDETRKLSRGGNRPLPGLRTS